MRDSYNNSSHSAGSTKPSDRAVFDEEWSSQERSWWGRRSSLR